MNAQGFFEGASLRDKLTAGMILGGPLALLLVLGLLFLRPEPIGRAAVFGCYTARGAPALEIKPDRIEIVEAGRRTLSYMAEPAKEGYRLAVRPALRLASVGNDRYDFQAERGIGFFWPLLTKASDSPKALRHPADFGGRFQMRARGGVAIIYTRSSDRRACE